MPESLMDNILDVVDGKIQAVNTALPGAIVRFPSSGKAEVQPLIKLKFADGTIIMPPVITNVVVIQPRTAAGGFTLPVAVGDPVLLVFSQWSIDRWASEGGLVEAGDARHHSMSDAFAIIGAYSFGEAPTLASGTVMSNGSTKVKLDGGKVAIGRAGVELLVNITKALDDAVAGFAAAVPPFVATDIIAASAAIKTITGSL